MCLAGAPGKVCPGVAFPGSSGMHSGVSTGCAQEMCFLGAPRCISELPQDTPKKVYPRHVFPGSSGEHSRVSAGCIQKGVFFGSSQMHPGAPEKHTFLEASYRHSRMLSGAPRKHIPRMHFPGSVFKTLLGAPGSSQMHPGAPRKCVFETLLGGCVFETLQSAKMCVPREHPENVFLKHSGMHSGVFLKRSEMHSGAPKCISVKLRVLLRSCMFNCDRG